MRKFLVFIFLIFIVSGCRTTPFDGHAIIDWVDFIKWDGVEYNGIYTAILADEKYIGEKLGTIKFKVADNVTNPNYKIRNGDAAFHEKGTEIFTVKGQPSLIAVKDRQQINGYKIYYSRDAEKEYTWHFKHVPIEKVNEIEFFKLYTSDGNKIITKYVNKDEINHIMQLLLNSKESPEFQPNTEKGDPDYYQIVLYTDGPIAYKFDLQYDGSTYYWYPWDTSILSNEIGTYLEVNPS
jgi:hypothetical protein